MNAGKSLYTLATSWAVSFATISPLAAAKPAIPPSAVWVSCWITGRMLNVGPISPHAEIFVVSYQQKFMKQYKQEKQTLEDLFPRQTVSTSGDKIISSFSFAGHVGVMNYGRGSLDRKTLHYEYRLDQTAHGNFTPGLQAYDGDCRVIGKQPLGGIKNKF